MARTEDRHTGWRSGRRKALAAVAGAAAIGLGVLALAPGAAQAAISGSLYVDPGTGGARWVAANSSDYRANVIRGLITVQPQAHWVTNGTNASSALSDLQSYVSAANSAGAIPQVVLYALPNRDCGGASAGGASDLNAYSSWISTVSRGLGSRTAIVILEPDGLALQTCLSSSEVSARDNALASAVTTIKSANSSAKVYLDGGHSAWNSASEQANRLRQAGVSRADGFFTNVSNFQTTSSEVAYGQSILSALGNSNLRQVIDTSRNGAGPGSGNWCDDPLPSSRRLGTAPTLSTGIGSVDAFLWVKLPGEADGCSNQAGSFQPANAYSLAGSGSIQPTQSTSPSPTTTSPSPTTTSPSPTTTSPSPTTTSPTPTTPNTSPSTTPSSGACTASYSVASSWNNGFQGSVTVKAGSSALNGWTVRWSLPSGQSITQSWSATVSVSGQTVTATNAAWNGSLGAGASTTFGFIGSGNGSSIPSLTCSAA